MNGVQHSCGKHDVKNIDQLAPTKVWDHSRHIYLPEHHVTKI